MPKRYIITGKQLQIIMLNTTPDIKEFVQHIRDTQEIIPETKDTLNEDMKLISKAIARRDYETK